MIKMGAKHLSSCEKYCIAANFMLNEISFANYFL